MQELMTKLVGMVGTDLAMKVAALVVADTNLIAVASVLIPDEASALDFVATFTPKPGGKVTTVHCGDRNTLYLGCSWGGSPSQGKQTGKSRGQKKPPEPWIEGEGNPYLDDAWIPAYKAVKKSGNVFAVDGGTPQKGRAWGDAGAGTCKVLADGDEVPQGCTAVHTSKVKGGKGPVGLLCLPTAVYRKGVELGLIEKDEPSEKTEESSSSNAPVNPFEGVDFGGMSL